MRVQSFSKPPVLALWRSALGQQNNFDARAVVLIDDRLVDVGSRVGADEAFERQLLRQVQFEQLRSEAVRGAVTLGHVRPHGFQALAPSWSSTPGTISPACATMSV
jgi:hypothetical protein